MCILFPMMNVMEHLLRVVGGRQEKSPHPRPLSQVWERGVRASGVAVTLLNFLPLSQDWERGPGGEGPFPAYPSQTWYLAADITCWLGLMPHIHGVDILDKRGNRTLARIDARFGWIPVVFECGFEHDEGCMVLYRWYRGVLGSGIVERWQVRDVGDGLVELSFSVSARGWLKRLLARAVIAPIARRQFDMIVLLAVSHRRAQEADGW